MGNSLSCYENQDGVTEEGIDASPGAYESKARARRDEENAEDDRASGQKLANLADKPSGAGVSEKAGQSPGSRNQSVASDAASAVANTRASTLSGVAASRGASGSPETEVGSQKVPNKKQQSVLKDMQKKIVAQDRRVEEQMERVRVGVTDDEIDSMGEPKVNEVCLGVANSLGIKKEILLCLPLKAKRDYAKAALDHTIATEYHQLVRECRKERTQMLEDCKREQFSADLLDQLLAWYKQHYQIDETKLTIPEEDTRSSVGFLSFLITDWVEEKRRQVEKVIEDKKAAQAAKRTAATTKKAAGVVRDGAIP
eukprot:TRINITY_DN7832_c0_g1_i1.p1 TRINITY_DN7832_c0_g1~~TRINITY_DN7832_c0_g1_i1.p1  ORF type:complete len:312 (+),score=86.56 TRINITY_DN7832_c0_g1_i1:201-1136(+)